MWRMCLSAYTVIHHLSILAMMAGCTNPLRLGAKILGSASDEDELSQLSSAGC